MYLWENELKELQAGIFDPLKKLERLWLQSNRLSVIVEGVFKENAKLKVLYLDNKILAIGPTVFDNSKALKDVNVKNGPCADMKSMDETLFRNTLQKSSCYEIYSSLITYEKGLKVRKSVSNKKPRDVAYKPYNQNWNFIFLIIGVFKILLVLLAILLVQKKY